MGKKGRVTTIIAKRFRWLVSSRLRAAATVVILVFSIVVPIILHSRPAEAAVVSQGPNSPNASSDCVNDATIGTTAWTNPGNASAFDTTYATASTSSTTQYIKCTNYNFNIPTSATIVGVVVGINRKSSSTAGSGDQDNAVRLVKGGTIGTVDRSTSTLWPTTAAYEDHGGSTDLWGVSLAPSDINASNFGATVSGKRNGGGSHTLSVDHMRITVYYNVFSKLAQTGYIWENDDDSGGSPIDEDTQQAAGSTAITGVKKGERLTLRMQLKSTGTSAAAANLGLFYDKNSDGHFIKASSPAPVVSGGSGCASSAWTCTAVDTTNDTGQYTSLAFDASGNPWVSYWDGTFGDLRVAQYVGSGGSGCASSAWTCTAVDTTNDMGQYTSIAFSPSGNPWVSYYDGTNNGLRVAQYVGSGGSGCASSAWTCTAVETTNLVGRYTSIAFSPAGNAYVSYNDGTNSGLRVAQYVGSGGSGCTSSAWTCTAVDTANDTGYTTSIAFDASGNPWVSYFDNTNFDLRVAQYVGSGGSGCTSSAWTCTSLDTTNDMGEDASIAFSPSGNAYVSYRDNTNFDLRVAQYVGSGGSGCTSSAWTCTAVDTANDVGYNTSIAFSPSGNAYVSYGEGAAGNLRVAQYVGSGGSGCASSAWTCTAVETTNLVGTNTSIAFSPAGNAYVSYYDSTFGDLRVAQLARNGDMSIVPSYAASSGNTLNESHADMTAVPDNTNRDDADCIGGGTWNNGLFSESEELAGLSIPAGDATAQCTEVAWTIDTSQATPGATYRFVVASKDNWRSDKGQWRGPISVSAYATLTIESNTLIRAAKDLQLKMTDCADTAWGCAAVDNTNNIGQYTSIAFSPAGTAYVSYYDLTNGNLRVAQYVGSGGTGCASSAWTCTAVDTANNVGLYTSIAFSPAGTAYVSYYDSSNGNLRVAQYVGSGGTGCASSAWTCTAVDTTNDVGTNSSIAFDASGNPWVSYYDFTNGNLRVAQYVGSGGTGCASSAWTCTAVDTTNDVGTNSSIAFSPAGTAYVSYQDGTNLDLRVAQYVGSGGSGCASSAWTCTAVDTANNVGFHTSIAFDASGNPWVSHADDTNSDLRVAQYVGSGGTGCASSAWTCTAVDTANNVGYNTSIAFSSSGNAYVSYRDVTNFDLRVAQYVGSGGTGCASSAWTCTAVDTTNDVGQYTSIAFDASGNPWVSYYDGTNGFLRVAKLHLPPTGLSAIARIAYPGRSARFGDGLFHLDSGYSPRTSSCGGTTDLKGYCGIASDDSDFDGITGTNERPMFTFAVKNTNPASVAKPTWVGRSNIAPSSSGTTGDLQMQVYNRRTKAWENLTSDSSSSDCSTADCSLSVQTSSNPEDYYEAIGSDWWIYFRVWQYENSSAETLRTDSFSVGFENTGAQLRHGSRFLNNIEGPFDL